MNEQKIINNALRYVLDLLEKVNHYPYHNINHTLDVYSRSDYLCDKEFIHLEDKSDILLGALFHDTGFIESYTQNEAIGARIAEEYLRKINWREDRIEKIKGIIMATIIGSTPNNKLEQIIQDADFDNLGRDDCLVKTMSLKKEIRLINKIDIPTKDWLLSTHTLFRKHQFNTTTSINERGLIKEENMRKLEARIATYK